MRTKHRFIAVGTAVLAGAAAITALLRPAGKGATEDQDMLTGCLKPPCIADKAHPLEDLQYCTNIPVEIPHSWVKHEQSRPWATMAFYLPDYCRAQIGFQWDHGGEEWMCDQIKVDVMWGYWGTESFGDGSQCRSMSRDVAVMRQVSGVGSPTSALTWYLTGRSRLEPLIGASSPDLADEALVRQIAGAAVGTPRNFVYIREEGRYVVLPDKVD